MDNLTDEKKEQEGRTTGEIFSNQPDQGVGYQEAEALPQEQYPEGGEQPQQGEGVVDQSTVSSPTMDTMDVAEGEGGSPSPPLFTENRFKKYIILAIGIVILLLIIVLFISFLFRKKPKPAGNITLTYWGLWEDKEIIQPVIDDYQKNHPNITVIYVNQNQSQYRERLQAAISRGEGPDIFRFHNTWVPMVINDLSPMPESIYSDSEFKNIFYPVAKADLKVGDNYYGIPLMIDGLMLFYNEDILKGANVSVPTTWVEVQSATSKLTVKEENKIITSAIAMGTAENIEHFSDILGLMMLQNGVQLGKSLFTCSDASKTDCAVEALSFYRKFAEAPNNTWDETLENSIVAFAQGKVAFIFAPSWQAFVIKAANPDLSFKTAPVPQLPCDKSPCPSINWASYWAEGVSSKSKNSEASWEFLKYLSSESTMKKFYELQVKSRNLFGEPYSRMELLGTLADNPYIGPLVSQAPTMKSFYLASRTFDGETGINSTLIKYLKDAVNSLSQGVSPESALKTADEGFAQVFSRFGIAASD